LECLSLCLHAPLWHDHLGYCTAEVGNSRGTYELPYILSSHCKRSNGCTTLSCRTQQHLLFPFTERYGSRSGLSMYLNCLRWEGFIITSIWQWLCDCFLTPGRNRIFPFHYHAAPALEDTNFLTSEQQLHDCRQYSSHCIKLIIQLL
jgi:hypothetical protein